MLKNTEEVAMTTQPTPGPLTFRQTQEMALGSALEAIRFLDAGDIANARALLAAIAREARAALRGVEATR